MCTVTVLPAEGGYQLTMNRDEYRSRDEAGLHRETSKTDIEGKDLQYCYPVDATSGGSWIGLNDRGIALCILNRYQVPVMDNAKSRGHIVTSALAQGSALGIKSYLQSLETDQFNAFDCLMVSHTTVLHFSWDREHYQCRPLKLDNGIMLTSSSERLEDVKQYRHDRFTHWQQAGYNSEDIDHFHLEQQDKMARSAMFMSRELTHTKSLSRIRVTVSECQLEYFDQQQLRPNERLSNLTATDSFVAPIRDNGFGKSGLNNNAIRVARGQSNAVATKDKVA